VDQKVTLKGLRILMDALLSDGTLIKQGAVAYIKEEYLHTHPAAQKAYECDAANGPFLIVDMANVEFVEHKDGKYLCTK
jgi:hypothetical protein